MHKKAQVVRPELKFFVYLPPNTFFGIFSSTIDGFNGIIISPMPLSLTRENYRNMVAVAPNA